MINIRKAKLSEIDTLMDIYAYATKFMEDHGNKNQWFGVNAVTREKVMALIDGDKLYVGESIGGCENGVCSLTNRSIEFVFAYIEGEDPTYKVITDGSWLNDEYYGTIHRLASRGRINGVVGLVTDWALSQNPNLRIDTHNDNVVMQGALKKAGFTKCGTIYLANGDPRIAYQKVR